MADRFGPGGNAPPSPLELAQGAVADLTKFLADNPALVDRDTARAAKLQRDRLYAAINELADAQAGESKPIRQALEDVKQKYTPTLNGLLGLKVELNNRINDFLKREQAAAAAEAQEKIRQAEALRLAALAAEAKLNQTRDDAKQGVFSDVGGALTDAGRAVADAARAQRQAAVAVKDAATVRLGGGFSRAVGIRAKKRLVLTDWKAALKVIGLTEALQEAILTASRVYHREHGAWPRGVEEREDDDGGQQ